MCIRICDEARLLIRKETRSEAVAGPATAVQVDPLLGRTRTPYAKFNQVRGSCTPQAQEPHNHNTTTKMRFLTSLLPSLLLGAGVVSAASSWGFDEAVISVSGKSAAGGGFKDK